MQINSLKKDFDILQKKFGDRNLRAIYGAGQINRPDIFFVFMNPTARNISAHDSWTGLRAPWLGTKNVWKIFYQIGVFDKDLYSLIKEKEFKDWDLIFAKRIYKEISDQKIYITNLSKSTKNDAQGLPNSIFKEYLPLLIKELSIIKPKIIITFGNQVSSIILNQSIKVSECRRKAYEFKTNSHVYPVYPVYYPVGQGMRNMKEAVGDIKWIIKNC